VCQAKLAVDMKTRGSLNAAVRSVCWDQDQFRLLVGTLGNEVYELNATDGNNVHANEPLLQARLTQTQWLIGGRVSHGFSGIRRPA
jgi:hypothetical protein